MAKRVHNEDLSMENYFNEGLANGRETNNPFEVAEPAHRSAPKKNAKKKKRTVQRGRVIGALCVAAVLVLGVWLGVFLAKRRNDGARYARLLAENIGAQIDVAQKNAGVQTAPKSAYGTLNQLYASYQALAESKKSCKIQGVRLPEWAIFCNTDAQELTNVTYYCYEVLEKNVFGTERKSYLNPHQLPELATVEQTEEFLGLKPYRIQYLKGRTQLREYRYCYRDGETGDVVSYVITAIWNENGQLASIADTQKNYIGTLLSSPEM